ncbi:MULTISPECIES: CZB domain-containing protein [unclassified Halomonas]|uniref:CZB domain-containing protein n=1 Tax=unclassified Halomonas TaxID=2609666 RepID=UPI0007D8F107|nr:MULTISPECIES: CZB domain-containing protein [unclassified Halomonas]MBT2785235.1 CZB domain-containing protein [Halomonas sp. ISL-106]MBT2799256.1 CZB domain-containing protein [Halomonas sp. ISL-104]OAL59520.1 chemotaxis protein [Halomonas sp. ALS9]
MFTFMHPYQKIRRLEQEVADLRAQLVAATPSPSCRLLSLVKPAHSIGMLQARGADMLASLNSGIQEYADQLAGERATLTETNNLIAAAEQAVNSLDQRCRDTEHAEALPPLVLAKTLHALSQLQVALARSAGHAQALAVSTALETAHSQGLLGSADAATQPSPGLAAIADDVHRLALTMHQLSHQLSLLMEQVNSQVREHSQAVVKKRLVDDEIALSAQTAKLALHQLADQTQHMHKVIHHSATAAFLHSAKLDHAVWKCRLYKQLLSANTDTPLEDHHQCRLGRWHQQGEGYQRYARTDAYRALTAPHRRMHDSGAEALKFARLGDRNGQLAALGVMEEASQQLALQLDNLMEHAMFEAPYSTSHRSPLAGAP